MPMPIMPKRTRSLAAVAKANRGSGSSRMVLAASEAPAAAALIPRNLRRDRESFSLSLLMRPPGVCVFRRLLLEFLDCDFFEEHDVAVTVILQADVAFQRSWTKLGFKFELARRHRIAFGVVGDLYAIQHDNGARGSIGMRMKTPELLL